MMTFFKYSSELREFNEFPFWSGFASIHSSAISVTYEFENFASNI